jgi:hypothetical protein
MPMPADRWRRLIDQRMPEAITALGRVSGWTPARAGRMEGTGEPPGSSIRDRDGNYVRAAPRPAGHALARRAMAARRKG